MPIGVIGKENNISQNVEVLNKSFSRRKNLSETHNLTVYGIIFSS